MITQTLEKFTKDTSPAVRREFDAEVGVIVLQDGRCLAYQEYGDRNGYPLFHCHSHGSSRLEGMLFDTAARNAGFRIISIDRPGTGLSDFRQYIDARSFAMDVVQLADTLRCRKFGVMACGGGAAYALAVCHLEPVRTQFMLGLSCIPPRSVSTLRKSSGFALRAVAEMTRLYIAVRHRLCARNPLYYLDRLRDTLCFSDRQLLQSPRVLELMRKDVDESMRQGARGIAHDISQSFAGWGFDLQSLTVPIHLWQGSADTLVSQNSAAKFAESVPSAVLHRVANRGHFFFLRGMEEVFSAVNSRMNSTLQRRSNLTPLRVEKGSSKTLARAFR